MIFDGDVERVPLSLLILDGRKTSDCLSKWLGGAEVELLAPDPRPGSALDVGFVAVLDAGPVVGAASRTRGPRIWLKFGALGKVSRDTTGTMSGRDGPATMAAGWLRTGLSV